jgi:multicomponent Na+:H+ antiporter subunit G
LALALVCLGAMLAMSDSQWTWRLLLVLGFLLATLPVSSHLLARAAVRETGGLSSLADAPLVGDDPAGAVTGQEHPGRD